MFALITSEKKDLEDDLIKDIAENDFPIVEVHWGDAWIETKDYSLEEVKDLSPICRKTIGYLIDTTDECIILATDLYEIEKDIINTPMIIPWGIVNEWYELEEL
tara:strand:+ start:244 stop:555 length:312 start_codon:yes stop_codon:yes gene_type:complete